MKTTYRKQESNTKYLLPIALIVFIVPLLVYMKLVDLSPIEMQYWTGLSNNADFFSYNKMLALITLTGLSILSSGFYFSANKYKIKKTNIYLPMAMYSVFIILSTLFAEHTNVALYGFVDRYEGMFSLLSYMILMFITINIVNDEKSIKSIIYPLIAGAVIIGIIGVFQYIGKDLFQSDFMKRLILPSEYKDQAQNIRFNFGKNTIYSTLYNTNYVGSYMVLLFPITLTLLILSKGIKKKLIMTPIAGLMFLNLLGSNSRGGILGTIFAMVVLTVMLRKQIIRNWKIVIISIVILSIGFVSINKISDGMVSNQITRLKDDIKGMFVQNDEIEDEYKMKRLIAEDNRLEIITTEETLNIEYEDSKFKFLDQDNLEIETQYDQENGIITLLNEKYEGYIFKLFANDSEPVLDLTLRGYNTKFGIENGEFKHYVMGGIMRDIKKVPSYGFEGKENIGSNRGYIWSRSIPMLKKSLILGSGPDTYAIYFPQDDFVGKFNTKVFQGVIVDKPHNLYLQIGINTGVVSLLAFLAMMIMYFIQSTKTYFNAKFDNIYETVGLAIFISICGYMVTGLFNDSVLSVATVFWILLGTGISINMKLLEDKR